MPRNYKKVETWRGNEYECGFCGALREKESSMRNHLRRHHDASFE